MTQYPNQKCLLAIKDCQDLHQFTNVSIEAIFKKFALGRIAKFPEEKLVIIQFQQFDELELLDMNFDDNKIPELGPNAYYDVESQVDPEKFINKILQNQTTSEINSKIQEQTETFQLNEQDLQDQTLKQKQIKEKQEQEKLENKRKTEQEQQRRREQQRKRVKVQEQKAQRLRFQQQKVRKEEQQRKKRLAEQQIRLRLSAQKHQLQQKLKRESQQQRVKAKQLQSQKKRQENDIGQSKDGNNEKLNVSDELQKLIEEEKKTQPADSLLDLANKRLTSKKEIDLTIIRTKQEPKEVIHEAIKEDSIKIIAESSSTLSYPEKLTNSLNEIRTNSDYYGNMNRYSSQLPLAFITFALISWIYYILTI